MIAQPPIDAASTMRMVKVVWDKLEPPIWELSLVADEEAAETWLVNVTESTETVGLATVVDGLVSGAETGVFEVEDEVGVDEVDEVVVVEETAELVGLVELIADVDELDEVEEVEAKEEGDVLGTIGAGPNEICETLEGVGEGEALEDGGVEELPTGGSLPAPMAPSPSESVARTSRGAGALILIMRLRSTWSRR